MSKCGTNFVNIGPSSLVINGDGTISHVSGNGTVTTFSTGSVSVFTDNGDGTYTHEDGLGNSVTVDVNSSMIANPDGSITHTAGDGSVFTFAIPAPVVSVMTANLDGSYTHISNGVSVNIPAGSISSMNNLLAAGNLIGTHVDGNGNSVNVLETITGLSFDAATNEIVYTKEDGTEDRVPLCNICPSPAIVLEKLTLQDGPFSAGDTIDYIFTVTNVGDTSLAGVQVFDTLATVVGGPISLAIGITDSSTFTASYVATAADEAAGRILNTATVTGVDPNGKTVNDADSVIVLSQPVVLLAVDDVQNFTTDYTNLTKAVDALTNDDTAGCGDTPTVALIGGSESSNITVANAAANGEFDVTQIVTTINQGGLSGQLENSLPLSLHNGDVQFDASFVGAGGVWGSLGVQFGNDPVLVDANVYGSSDYLITQPTLFRPFDGKEAVYEFTFPNHGAVMNFSFLMSGLNFGDAVTVTSFLGGVQNNVEDVEFETDVLMAVGPINTVTGYNPSGGIDVDANIVTIGVPVDTDRVVVTMTKPRSEAPGGNSNYTVTTSLWGISFDDEYTFDYTLTCDIGTDTATVSGAFLSANAPAPQGRVATTNFDTTPTAGTGIENSTVTGFLDGRMNITTAGVTTADVITVGADSGIEVTGPAGGTITLDFPSNVEYVKFTYGGVLTGEGLTFNALDGAGGTYTLRTAQDAGGANAANPYLGYNHLRNFTGGVQADPATTSGTPLQRVEGTTAGAYDPLTNTGDFISYLGEDISQVTLTLDGTAQTVALYDFEVVYI